MKTTEFTVKIGVTRKGKRVDYNVTTHPSHPTLERSLRPLLHLAFDYDGKEDGTLSYSFIARDGGAVAIERDPDMVLVKGQQAEAVMAQIEEQAHSAYSKLVATNAALSDPQTFTQSFGAQGEVDRITKMVIDAARKEVPETIDLSTLTVVVQQPCTCGRFHEDEVPAELASMLPGFLRPLVALFGFGFGSKEQKGKVEGIPFYLAPHFFEGYVTEQLTTDRDGNGSFLEQVIEARVAEILTHEANLVIADHGKLTQRAERVHALDMAIWNSESEATFKSRQDEAQVEFERRQVAELEALKQRQQADKKRFEERQVEESQWAKEDRQNATERHYAAGERLTGQLHHNVTAATALQETFGFFGIEGPEALETVANFEVTPVAPRPVKTEEQQPEGVDAVGAEGQTVETKGNGEAKGNGTGNGTLEHFAEPDVAEDLAAGDGGRAPSRDTAQA